jgi:hypothetical protein
LFPGLILQPIGIRQNGLNYYILKLSGLKVNRHYQDWQSLTVLTLRVDIDFGIVLIARPEITGWTYSGPDSGFGKYNFYQHKPAYYE